MSLFIPQTIASNTWTVHGPDWINWLFSKAVVFCRTLTALKKVVQWKENHQELTIMVSL